MIDQREKIKVYLQIKDGRTVCICTRRNRCKNFCPECEAEVVTRDRLRGWQHYIQRDRYGR